MPVTAKDTVRVHYTGHFPNGEIFDSSRGGEPLEVTLGRDQLIPGFEAAVIGMQPGEAREAVIPAAQAYGPHHPELVFEVARDHFPPGLSPELGQRLDVSSRDGRTTPVTVTRVSEQNVTLDANHPLAGKDLVFKIELLEILPTAKE